MPSQPTSAPSTRFLRAAQYLRMSTEHQQYSIANQSAAIALYAAAHNIGIVRSFTDEGKSGMTIEGRRGLQELLRTVQSGTPDFELILVYDVSRWGRFPDVDEAAHYEFLCKKAGTSVRYCAEQFENDNSTTSNLVKALKRTMAGEYSRELSVKVSTGMRRLASMGLWLGGPPPFGMMRQLIDVNGKPKRILKPGERKSIQTDRIVLKPGPKKEVKIVRLIFDLFTEKRMCQGAIQTHLNQNGLLRRGRLWGWCALRCLLRNPVYKGSSVFGRHDFKRGQKKRLTSPETWIVRDGVLPAIISPQQFGRAQALVAARQRRLDNSDMLAKLTRLWNRQGELTSTIINRAKGVPRTATFVKHFGSLSNAYDLIGYPHRDCTYAKVRPTARVTRDKLCEEICYRVRAIGGTAERRTEPGVLLINGAVTAEVKVTVGLVWREGRPVWWLPITMRPAVDVLILARIEPQEYSVLDYYVVPRLANIKGKFLIKATKNVAFLDIHRVKSLTGLMATLRRSRIPEV
jgi:DNA invertase Pin-like site-specific DNA recombinase